jgi:molybdopterin-guanine dinucleotide biosynthesis protein A
MSFQTGIEGFILAGGASSRMGQDKARLRLGAHTFVERIGQALAPVVDRTTVVTSENRRAEWDLPVAIDVFTDWGALGGLHAALTACQGSWALVVACDLPLVTTELFRVLAAVREGFEAVAPIQPDGFEQPLCALYRVDPCRQRAEDLIAAGERRPRMLLRAVHTRWVNVNELDALEGAPYLFSNINTPQEYESALQLLKGESRKESET